MTSLSSNRLTPKSYIFKIKENYLNSVLHRIFTFTDVDELLSWLQGQIEKQPIKSLPFVNADRFITFSVERHHIENELYTQILRYKNDVLLKRAEGRNTKLAILFREIRISELKKKIGKTLNDLRIQNLIGFLPGYHTTLLFNEDNKPPLVWAELKAPEFEDYELHRVIFFRLGSFREYNSIAFYDPHKNLLYDYSLILVYKLKRPLKDPIHCPTFRKEIPSATFIVHGENSITVFGERNPTKIYKTYRVEDYPYLLFILVDILPNPELYFASEEERIQLAREKYLAAKLFINDPLMLPQLYSVGVPNVGGFTFPENRGYTFDGRWWLNRSEVIVLKNSYFTIPLISDKPEIYFEKAMSLFNNRYLEEKEHFIIWSQPPYDSEPINFIVSSLYELTHKELIQEGFKYILERFKLMTRNEIIRKRVENYFSRLDLDQLKQRKIKLFHEWHRYLHNLIGDLLNYLSIVYLKQLDGLLGWQDITNSYLIFVFQRREENIPSNDENSALAVVSEDDLLQLELLHDIETYFMMRQKQKIDKINVDPERFTYFDFKRNFMQNKEILLVPRQDAHKILLYSYLVIQKREEIIQIIKEVLRQYIDKQKILEQVQKIYDEYIDILRKNIKKEILEKIDRGYQIFLQPENNEHKKMLDKIEFSIIVVP